MQTFSSPLPVIRPALPRDKADVAEFTKSIWDGHDYVGHIFPEWLEDPHGILLAAEYAGRCIGCAKVSFIAAGEWWLEGFRVDPNFQDQKIGSQLDAAANEWWDEHGEGALRLLTSSKRVKVHHLCETRGFRRVGEVLAYAAEPLDETTDTFTPLLPEDVSEAVERCRHWTPNGFVNIGWRFAAPGAESIRAAQKEILFYWWRGRRGLVSAWEDDEDGAARLIVGLEACAEAERVQLLEDVRRLGFARGADVVEWMNVINDRVRRDLETAQYRKEWEDTAYLYERRKP